MKMKRIAALLLTLAMLIGFLPIGTAQAAPSTQPPSATDLDTLAAAPEATVLPDEAYVSVQEIFAQIDAAQAAPAKKNASQQTEAAIAIVTASDSYVEGSLERNGDSFTWWTTDGIHCVYHPRMQELAQDMTPQTGIDAVVNAPHATKGGYPSGTQVYLIGPYYGYDSSFSDHYKYEANRVANLIGDTDGYTLYSGKTATVDRVAEAVSNGAVVFFDSHGNTDYQNPNNKDDCVTGAANSYLCLTSTTGLTTADYNAGALYGSGGAWINGQTIANHMTKRSPGGMLWMSMCLGMATDTICRPMRNMGVEVVYGYSESVTFGGDYLYLESFWNEIRAGKNVSQAVATMKSTWGNWDWSEQIAACYGQSDGYATLADARAAFKAFPIVVSDEDAYPGKRTASSYGADSLQTVRSTYTLKNPNASLGGLCGATAGNVRWSLKNGVLSITGSGAMAHFEYLADIPWYSYREQIRSIVVGSGVTTIGRGAFYGCNAATSVSLPATLTGISSLAFAYCSSLTSVSIPAAVTEIDGQAFEGCQSLTAFSVASGSSSFSTDAAGVLFNQDKTTLLRMPSGFSGSYTVPAGVTLIDFCAFFGCDRLTAVTIPTTLTEIGAYAFSGCQSLTDIHYLGVQTQWERITVGQENPAVTEATVHYANIPPVITQHPQSVSAYDDGSQASFYVTADGNGLTYQWQYSKDGGSTWHNSSAATQGYNTTALRVDATLARNGFLYRCKVTDTNGTVVYSEAATLTVTLPPVIITQQPQDMVAVSGTKVTFTVKATGENLRYNWLWNANDGRGWCSFYPEGNTDTLTVTASSTNNHYQYRCDVTSGNYRVQSESATLTVIADGASFHKHPEDVTVQVGEEAVFSVQATGTIKSYQWQYSIDGTHYWISCDATYPGYNTDTVTVTGDPSRNGSRFRCLIYTQKDNVVCSDYSILTVDNGRQFIIGQPEDVTTSEGAPAVFSVQTDGAAKSYQWQYSDSDGEIWYNSTSATPGYNTATLTVTAAMSRNGFVYRCRVVDSDGAAYFTNKVTLTVLEATYQFLEQPQSVTAEEGSQVQFSVKIDGTDLKYQWQYSRGGGNLWYNSSSATVGYNTDTLTVTASLERDGYLYRCQVTNGDGVVMTSDAAKLTVQEVPLAFLQQPSDKITTPGKPVTFQVEVNRQDASFRWYYRTSSTASWQYPVENVISYEKTLTITPTLAHNGYQFRCSVSSRGTTRYSDIVTLTVKDAALELLEQPESVTVEDGEDAVFLVAAKGDGLTYSWQYSTNNGSSWQSCSAATVGYNTNVLIVTGTRARDGFRYRCKVTDTYGNVVYSDAAVLTVNGPVLEITRQPESITVEEDTNALFTVAVQGEGITYRWQYSTNGGSSWQSCSAATVGYNTDTLTVVGTRARDGFLYRCKVTDTYSNVIYSEAVTLTVNKLPIKFTTQPQPSTTKLGNRATFHVAVLGEELTYRWQYSLNGKAWYSTSSYTTGYNTDTLTVIAEAKRDGFLYRCKVTDGSGNVAWSDVVALTVQLPEEAAIVTQPVDQGRMIGKKAVFQVTFQGSIASIQWQYQTKPGTAWYNSSAATAGYNTDTLTVQAEAKRNGFRYRCVITDTEGYIHTSAEALLTITKAQFDADPADVTAKVGAKAVFRVSVSGSYQQVYWQYSTDGGSSWYASSLTGCKTTAMTVGVTAARDGFLYRCVLIDADGIRIISQPAQLTVQ